MDRSLHKAMIGVCDVLNGVHTTMEVDTGTASSMIGDQQFSLILRGNRNLTLSKDGLPKLRMYSGACLQSTGIGDVTGET